jgi:Fic family protein
LLLDPETEAFKELAAGNLERQFELLRDLVSALLTLEQPERGIDVKLVCWLHAHAMVGLVETPGSFRQGEVQLNGSPHKPPSRTQVSLHMIEFVQDLKARWKTEDPIVLAAYSLWQLAWIHPFEDGNGRTARALAYLVLCLKFGGWLPGQRTVFESMMTFANDYNTALRNADISFSQGKLDLEPLSKLFAEHIALQVFEKDLT